MCVISDSVLLWYSQVLESGMVLCKKILFWGLWEGEK